MTIDVVMVGERGTLYPARVVFAEFRGGRAPLADRASNRQVF
jgi:hypothetical protein